MIPFFISFVTSKRSIESINKAWDQLKRQYPSEQHILDSIESAEQWEKWVENHDVPDEQKTLWFEKERYRGIAPTPQEEADEKEKKDSKEKEHKRIRHPLGPVIEEQALNTLDELREKVKEGKELTADEKATLKDLEGREQSLREVVEKHNAFLQEMQQRRGLNRFFPGLTGVRRQAPQQPAQTPSPVSSPPPARRRGTRPPPNIFRLGRFARSILSFAKLSPQFWITLLIILVALSLLIALVFFIMTLLGGFGGGSSSQNQGPAPSPSATDISIDIVPENGIYHVNNGEQITFKITASNNLSQPVDVEVDVSLPSNVDHDHIETLPNFDQGTTNWTIKGLSRQSIRTIKLKPNQDDTPVTVTVSIKYAPGFSPSLTLVPSGPTNPPNSNTCNGTYSLDNKDHINFGDPSCNFDRNQLRGLIQAQDPNLATIWFYSIIPNESSYNPNAWVHCFSNGLCTPDPNGAWGLFQMGDGTSSHGPLDNGKADWPSQATNAMQYNKTKIIPGGGTLCDYWQAAKDTGNCAP